VGNSCNRFWVLECGFAGKRGVLWFFFGFWLFLRILTVFVVFLGVFAEFRDVWGWYNTGFGVFWWFMIGLY